MGVVEWLKFYFLGFFSEKQARKSNWTGALTIIFSAVLAFLLFFYRLLRGGYRSVFNPL